MTRRTGTLYVVATPIGNLQDCTFRAVEVLGRVAVIACEDTRTTSVLLKHYSISTPTLSYHEHNEKQRVPQIVERLRRGQDIALVSDAGTPGISDPGYRLVQAAHAEAITVIPVPGASALLAALAASGLPTDRFFFAGFLAPRKQARRRQLEALRSLQCTMIVYESPRRVQQTLADIAEILGPQRPIVIARELTKVYEEFIRGQAGQLATGLKELRGEVTILVGIAEDEVAAQIDTASLREEYQQLLATGSKPTDAVRQLSRRYGLPRREVYDRVRK